MWPLYVLFNKVFQRDENTESEVDDSSLIESYSFQPEIQAGSHFVEVKHIQQLNYWDCGLACVLMVLHTVGINGCQLEDLVDLCHTTSIWTVDLAYLLHKFSVNFSYFTVTFGANPHYSLETFYKEQLTEDLVRVNSLFRKALDVGINVERRSISREEITFMILSGKYIAIVLVDQYKLSQCWMKDVLLSGFCGTNTNYVGHYIVVCGYDGVADEFEIRDPASSRVHSSMNFDSIGAQLQRILEQNKERVSSQCLEEARKSFGTDEDLLLISLEKNDDS